MKCLCLALEFFSLASLRFSNPLLFISFACWKSKWTIYVSLEFLFPCLCWHSCLCVKFSFPSLWSNIHSSKCTWKYLFPKTKLLIPPLKVTLWLTSFWVFPHPWRLLPTVAPSTTTLVTSFSNLNARVDDSSDFWALRCSISLSSNLVHYRLT
jgi:hypothetical protein